LPALDKAISQYESLVSPYKKTKVTGIALKCPEMTRVDCQKEMDRIENWLGLPTTDPMQFGTSRLVDAILNESSKERF
jgi:uncharacterized NAD-dependent epimerase/dehydratase family protein